MSWLEVRKNIVDNINNQIINFQKTNNCGDRNLLIQNISKIQYDTCKKIRKSFLNEVCKYTKRNVLSYILVLLKIHNHQSLPLFLLIEMLSLVL